MGMIVSLEGKEKSESVIIEIKDTTIAVK